MTVCVRPRDRKAPLLALASGSVAANVYYAQPVAGIVTESLGGNPAAAGLIVTLTQLGYGVGLLLIVPLADMIENRRMIVGLVAIAFAGLLLSAAAGGLMQFLLGAGLVGLGSVAVQVLVPYATRQARPGETGRVIGLCTAGLMLGITFARPASGLLTQAAGWRAPFLLGAAVMLVVGAVLWRSLKPYRPLSHASYGSVLWSMVQSVRQMPVLRQRILVQSALFGTFSLFWTVIPFHLRDAFGLAPGAIGLFALAGAVGILVAPIAGRIADAGHATAGTVGALFLAIAAFGTALLSPATPGGFVLLAIAGILLEIAVTGAFVIGQREIFAAAPEMRARLNGVFMASYFVAGGCGSAWGGWAYISGSWSLCAWAGLIVTGIGGIGFIWSLRRVAVSSTPGT